MKRVWLVLPPMSQINTPYPSTAYLAGFLRAQGYPVSQSDASLELFLRLMSRAGLESVQGVLTKKTAPFFQVQFAQYRDSVEPVIRFLQGRDPTLAYRIVTRKFLPEGPRFQVAQDAAHMEWAFGVLGLHDRARFLASLYLDDLADVIRQGVDPRFQLSRYGESLASSQGSFDKIYEDLRRPPTLVEKEIDQWTIAQLKVLRPQVLGLSVPFPGNVLGAFRIASAAKKVDPDLKVILGGGFVNTELRSLSDPRVFDTIDYVTFDDGEVPFQAILEDKGQFLRTLVRNSRGQVEMKNDPLLHDLPQKHLPPPSYEGLPLEKYVSILELLNPMHRIWSDARWNKLTLAHGCYWKKCSFCDVTLDYIGRYDPVSANALVDRMVEIHRQTGTTGFHFVDEAAPPALLRQLSLTLIERGLSYTWWGNIRFEKSFDRELCELMAQAGCVAVSGGLEVASDRLLKKMNKGVSVEQVARVTHAFSQAGVMVHAYLMYGFPSQTVQETVDALERVRQLFSQGCIQSAFWHRFSATIHSPIGKNPQSFGIRIKKTKKPEHFFAENDLPFTDSTPADHEALGVGLNRALFNYMQGLGLDLKVNKWFDQKVPVTKVSSKLISSALAKQG